MKWISVGFSYIISRHTWPFSGCLSRIVLLHFTHSHSVYWQCFPYKKANDLLPIGQERAVFNSYFSDVAFRLSVYRRKTRTNANKLHNCLLCTAHLLLWNIKCLCFRVCIHFNYTQSNVKCCVHLFTCIHDNVVRLPTQIIACQNEKP